MQDPVHGQGSRLAETLAALGALERLFLRVDVPVIPQVVLPAESLVTNIARVRPFIRMSPFVNEQVVGLGEPPLAELAHKLFLRSRRRAVARWPDH